MEYLWQFRVKGVSSVQFGEVQLRQLKFCFFFILGNLKKQQALRERLNRGVPIDLDDGEFTVRLCPLSWMKSVVAVTGSEI